MYLVLAAVLRARLAGRRDNGGLLGGRDLPRADRGLPLRLPRGRSTIDQTEALLIASRTVGFPVGHAQRAARLARPAVAAGVAHPALQRRRAADDARPRRARRRRRPRAWASTPSPTPRTGRSTASTTRDRRARRRVTVARAALARSSAARRVASPIGGPHERSLATWSLERRPFPRAHARDVVAGPSSAVRSRPASVLGDRIARSSCWSRSRARSVQRWQADRGEAGGSTGQVGELTPRVPEASPTATTTPTARRDGARVSVERRRVDRRAASPTWQRRQPSCASSTGDRRARRGRARRWRFGARPESAALSAPQRRLRLLDAFVAVRTGRYRNRDCTLRMAGVARSAAAVDPGPGVVTPTSACRWRPCTSRLLVRRLARARVRRIDDAPGSTDAWCRRNPDSDGRWNACDLESPTITCSCSCSAGARRRRHRQRFDVPARRSAVADLAPSSRA